MKNLFYLLFLCFSVVSLSAEEWEYKNLPSDPFYKVQKDIESDKLILEGIDAIPGGWIKYDVDYEFYYGLKKEYYDLGLDTTIPYNISIINPFHNVLFTHAAGIETNLYSQDGGRNWNASTSGTNGLVISVDSQSFLKYDNGDKVGDKCFLTQNNSKTIYISRDSCKSWQVFEENTYANFVRLQAVNDSTLFFIKHSDYTADSAVYYNINAETYEASFIPNNIFKWANEPTEVRGDTIAIFGHYGSGEVFRSTDKGKNWEPWFEMVPIFDKFSGGLSKEGVEYSFDKKIIISSLDYNYNQKNYCVSFDFGITWYFIGTNDRWLNKGFVYLPAGTYQKYDTRTDEVSEVYFAKSKYGNIRKQDNEVFYQNQVGDTVYYKNSSSWNPYQLAVQQRIIGKFDQEFYLNNNQLYLGGQQDKLLFSDVSSFKLLKETPWIDVLEYSSNIDGKKQVAFIKDRELVFESEFEFANPQAGLDLENPDYLYYANYTNNKLVSLISYDISTQLSDQILITEDIAADNIISIYLAGNRLYIICREKIFISENRGQSFLAIDNPQTYNNNDNLVDNSALYQGDLYLAGEEGVLLLADDLTWVDITEDVTETYAFGVEFIEDKIYVYAEAGLFISGAKNNINTSDENRNTIIETFGGIYSGYTNVYCYYADRLQNDYAGRFSYIVYHPNHEVTTPKNDTDPDFRTEGADSILAYIKDRNDLNRRYMIDITDGSEVTDPMDKIHAQTSEVNISVSADVNPDTRELTADVSYLYKKEGSGSHTLSVFILQDYIKGKQAIYTNYMLPPFAADSQYYHRNIFRMSLSDDAKGDKISNTSEDVYGERNFKLILPDSIRNVKLELADLKLIAFITRIEDQSMEVLQVMETKVNLPDENLANLSIADTTDTKHKYFFEDFMPKVHITNHGTTGVHQFDLQLKLSDTTYSNTYFNNINNGSSETVIVDTIKADFVGNYSFAATGFGNLNNSDLTGDYLADNNPLDNDCLIKGIRLQRDAFVYTKFSFEDDSDKNYGIEYDNGLSFNLIKSTKSDSTGAENSDNTLKVYLSSASYFDFKTAYVVFGEADFTSVSEAYMSYYYAYYADEAGGTPPTYTSEFSTDGGDTWIELHSMNPKQTSSAQTPNHKLHSSEYIKEYVSLSECIGKKVIVRIGVTAGANGVLCWLDQVSFTDKCPTISSESDRINFGKVTVLDGVYVEENIKITNIGEDELRIDTASIKGDDAASFEIVTPISDQILQIGESREITVRFSPTKNMLYLAKLEIKSNDPENKPYNIRLEGEGVGTSVDDMINSEEMTISPNPAIDFIEITFDSDIEQLQIIDLYGNIQEVEPGIKRVDITNLPAGSYFLKAKFGSTTFFKKFVVIR